MCYFTANLSNAFKEKRKENIVVGDIGDVLLAAVNIIYVTCFVGYTYILMVSHND
jgi:hypothetical protein